MVRTVIILVALAAAACGSVDDRGDCASSADCPVGQYCAQTPDGNVCWGDAAAPVVTGVSASCADAGGCRRDSVLRVTATVSDATSGVLDASVALDLPGGPAVPMARSGAQWTADVDLRQFPFEHFERSVVATVTARDGARNPSAGARAAAVNVTRLRWERAIDSTAIVSPTAPAVQDDGTVVIGGSNGKLYLVSPSGADAAAPLAVGAGQLTAAPAIGEHAIWIGSEDFGVYAAELDGSATKAQVGVNLGGPVRGSLAVMPGTGKDWVFATATGGDGVGIIGVSSSAATERNVTLVPVQEGFWTGPVMSGDGGIHAATSTSAGAATLRRYSLTTAPVALGVGPTAVIGKRSSAPLAIDGQGGILVGADESTPLLRRIVPAASPTVETVGELVGAVAESPLVLEDGDVVVGDESGRLHRFGASGPVWSSPPALAAPIRGPLALSGTTSRFVVPTNAGKVFAIANDGQTRWQGSLPAAANGLRAANLHTPPGQTSPVMSTAYFASGNGRLYAVVVDGQLDASAPWPKAFHDPKNTNRAGPQP